VAWLSCFLLLIFHVSIVKAHSLELSSVQALLSDEQTDEKKPRGFFGHCSNALITVDGVEYIDEKHIRLSPRLGQVVIESEQLTTRLILGDSPYISDYVRLACDLSSKKGRLILWTACDGNGAHCNQGYDQFQIDLETHVITAMTREEAGAGGQK
jgi:hypothetical protein